MSSGDELEDGDIFLDACGSVQEAIFHVELNGIET
jgi:hypothetical protein